MCTVNFLLASTIGLYFEKILKTVADVSVWMRNVQLAACAVPIAAVGALATDGNEISELGLFYGFDAVVW